MNNIIFQTIRAGAVLGIALFAFASEALAAPYLTPVTVSEVTGTSAMIVGHVSNPHNQSTVWFEINNINGVPTTVAVQGIWSDGIFKWYLDNLNPGQTYSYRAVATDGSNTVYSPTSSFTTLVPRPATPITISYQSTSVVATPTQTPAVNATQSVPQTITTIKEATTTPEGFTNNNAASVIGSGGVLPTTLIGWMLLLVSLLVLVIIAHMIYEEPKKRKKAALAKIPEEEKPKTE